MCQLQLSRVSLCVCDGDTLMQIKTVSGCGEDSVRDFPPWRKQCCSRLTHNAPAHHTFQPFFFFFFLLVVGWHGGHSALVKRGRKTTKRGGKRWFIAYHHKRRFIQRDSYILIEHNAWEGVVFCCRGFSKCSRASNVIVIDPIWCIICFVIGAGHTKCRARAPKWQIHPQQILTPCRKVIQGFPFAFVNSNVDPAIPLWKTGELCVWARNILLKSRFSKLDWSFANSALTEPLLDNIFNLDWMIGFVDQILRIAHLLLFS